MKLKRILLICFALLIATAIVIYLLGYHGPRSFTGSQKMPPVELVTQKARSLAGTPYDPLMGMHNNIGAKLGFIVCSDVPNIAFGLSGYSWEEVLTQDFKANRKFYNSANGNQPGNPYFHRRARNMYSYFVANQKLVMDQGKPKIGDLAFYRKSEKGMIAHVAIVTEITDGGFKVMESAPKTILAQEVGGTSPIDRGWIFAGFGRIY